MNLYLESSAALRDVLEGESAPEIRAAVARADVVVTSRLTLAEIARVLARLRALEPGVAAQVAAREAAFLGDSERWAVQPVDEDIWIRCGRPFPVEPVRLLDAIHLATIEKVSGALSRLVVMTTDVRVRRNAVELGFEVLPPGQ
jgi:predicted nucleic acid-binding protein